MQVELKDIKGGVLEQEYSCSLTDFPDLNMLAQVDGPKYLDPQVFKLRLQRTGKFVEVDGHLDAVVRLNCGRCLQDFEKTVSESFSVTFVPQVEDEEVDDEVELEADDLGLVVYAEETLDFRDTLQEQLLMAVPIKPLCAKTCQGLCPECGKNLNIEKCSCTKKPFNNKFTALAGIDFKKT
ncbi:uncharacterized protein SAMN05660420_02799 [Desulfuromusa kysingii]|uniref:DUF177 domain-containing protein n=1 Tax=Desulfuromusa kysingii TaxID=37625 RepID=A0A1H4D245_9BACT|nr:DUF177 domain-containing protein [Desulfuromusa kysingii]SEA66853.1 uncharacterized protein SAMN05660420_02799 [Desulfuromusa kysingii]